MKALVTTALALFVVAFAGRASAAEDRCGALAHAELGESVVVHKAAYVAAAQGLPAHCRVEGVIEPRTGRNGRPYGIGFAVALPDLWNGRFLFQGGGGLNGTVAEPLGRVAAGNLPGLARGFAVATTDSGHRGAVFDTTFLEDQEATLNFLYDGVAKTTRVARQVVATYYGRRAQFSYFAGCSTGGREGMMMSQRFPNLFDGIIAGAPAMRTNYSNLATRWISDSLNAVAPRDPNGLPLTAQALSPAQKRLVVDGLLKACDALDGQEDGLIHDVRGCRFDPAVLVCKAGESGDACLTQAQADAIRRGFGGPRTRAGVQVYPGFPYDTGIAAEGGGIPGLLFGGTQPEGPRASAQPMDVDAEAAAAHDARHLAGDTHAWTNLSTFTARGGKLIFFHGVSDPWFSALDTVRYYEELARANAPLETADWSRLFLVPGMAHCSGGQALDKFDLLAALVAWVEDGKAPEYVVATGDAFPGRSRPLCPWPRHAQYTGRGNPETAEAYICR